MIDIEKQESHREKPIKPKVDSLKNKINKPVVMLSNNKRMKTQIATIKIEERLFLPIPSTLNRE